MAGPWERYQKPAAQPTGSAGGAPKPWERFTASAPAPAGGFVAPEPPPGVVIHGGDGRSYVAEHPEIGVARTAPAGSRDEAIQQQALRARAATDGTVSDFARAARPFAQGQSLNFGDELVSAIFAGAEGLRGGDVGDAYDFGQEYQRQELERRRQEAPLTSLATEMAGGFATGAAAAPRVFSSGAGLLANTLRGSAAGAASGAAAGFGGGSGLDDRLEDLIVNGGIGAALGGAIPLAAAGVRKGVEAFHGARAARETLPAIGIGRRTADQIGRELERDALSPEAARAEVQRMGSDAMLLDVGDNLSGGAEAVANAPGAGNRQIRDRLRDRNAGAPGRIAAAADDAIGPARNIAETADELIARRSAASGPLYAQALERPIGWNDRMQAFMDDPITKGGLRKGLEIQRLEALARNERFDPVDYNITDFNAAGDPIITGTPNMRTLNVIKKGLDNIVEGYRDPTTGRLALDEYGRAVNEVQRSFLKELDGLNPDYAAARTAYAGPTRVRDALSLGQDVFNRSVRPDQLRQRLDAMSDAEREAFQIGARDQLSEIMGTARRDATAARGMFETGWNREKLGLLLGDDDAAGRFLDTLGTETRFANGANAVTGGSASARRLERVGEYNGQRGAARAAVDPASGLWGDTKRVLARGADALLDGRAARSAEEMRGEFGDAVSRQGADRDELLDAIMGYQGARRAATDRAIPKEELMRAILSGGALALASQADH